MPRIWVSMRVGLLRCSICLSCNGCPNLSDAISKTWRLFGLKVDQVGSHAPRRRHSTKLETVSHGFPLALELAAASIRNLRTTAQLRRPAIAGRQRLNCARSHRKCSIAFNDNRAPSVLTSPGSALTSTVEQVIKDLRASHASILLWGVV